MSAMSNLDLQSAADAYLRVVCLTYALILLERQKDIILEQDQSPITLLEWDTLEMHLNCVRAVVGEEEFQAFIEMQDIL